ncbi:MAG: DUF1572 family protein [Ignavibacteriae bacterium]|nr:DUF1572 family protein [Ignavibacteriota bacterium]
MLSSRLCYVAVHHLYEGVERISTCFSQLSEEDIWRNHNANLVSIGNLVLHLQGNVSQYIIQGLGGEEYHRHRDGEFSEKPGLSREELLERITGTIDQAAGVIEGLDEAALLRAITIQGFEHTGLSALIHVVEHFSYHVGQITFATKYLKDVDLGYYAGLDLNAQ